MSGPDGEPGRGPSRKRERRVMANPNPLFSQWLREWRDEAAQAGSQARHTYARALQSLAKFPIPLLSGSDCIILKNFGQKICDMLDKKLAEYRQQNPDWRPERIEVAGPTPAEVGKVQSRTRGHFKTSRGKQPEVSEEPVACKEPKLSCRPTNEQTCLRIDGSAARNELDKEAKGKTKHAALSTLRVNPVRLKATPLMGTNLNAVMPPTNSVTVSSVNINSQSKTYTNTVNDDHPITEVRGASSTERTEETMGSSSERRPCAVQCTQKEPLASTHQAQVVIDLSNVDSPSSKADSDDDDSFLIPLSTRLAALRNGLALLGTPKTRRVKKGRESARPQADIDDDDCIIVAQRLRSPAMPITSPCRVQSTDGVDEANNLAKASTSLSPANPSPSSARSEAVAAAQSGSTELLTSQEESFCPAQPMQSRPNDSILDMSLDICRQRSDFLARLDDTATVVRSLRRDEAAPCVVSSIDDRGLSSPISRRPVLSLSLSSIDERSATPKCCEKLYSIHEALPQPAMTVEPAPASGPVVHTLSDSDDDLPPLALRVNNLPKRASPDEPSQQAQKLSSPPPLQTPEADSFAALLEDVVTPPSSRVTCRAQYSTKNLIEDVPSRNGMLAHKLKVARKENTRDERVDHATGSANGGEAVKQRKKRGKKDCAPSDPGQEGAAATAASVEVVPLRLEYVPYGSRPLRLSEEDHTSRCLQKITFYPGTFEVVLCVDSCEATGGLNSKKKQVMIEALRNAGIPLDIRKMNVGDFAWIARRTIQNGNEDGNNNNNGNNNGKELVLDCIVERKRTDDLASSIKDGRYREQKHRLLTSGVRRKIYLIEECNRFASGGISDLALLQAQINTQVMDDFVIKRTRSVKESAQYIAMLTQALTARYKNRVLKSCLKEEAGQLSDSHLMSWQEFNESSRKGGKISTRQVFTRALMVLKGMSLEKALAVVGAYPTIVSLMEAYERCEQLKQRQLLLADLKCSISGRRLGPAMSKSIYKFIIGEEIQDTH